VDDCTHDDQRLTVRNDSQGRALYCNQCQECGWIGPFLKHAEVTAEMRAVAVPFDPGLQRDHWRRKSERSHAEWQAKKDSESADWQRRYDDYLKSWPWKRRQAAVLARDKTCRGCMIRPSVEVHHLTYERVGREMLFDLVGVCSECHRAIHGTDREAAG
jgi:5-methylcytosine-specific restriction endonuclease McrA